MPSQPPPKSSKSRPTPANVTGATPVLAPTPPILPAASASGDVALGIVADVSRGGVITARKAGDMIDLSMQVDPKQVGVAAALQHLAKAINIAFQSDFSENELEAVYQAAIVRRGEVYVVHREYFGFQDSWFGQFGRLLKTMQLTFEGPDPASPEGRKRFAEKGPSSIRGLFNLLGRKLDLVPEYEDRVPAYVEQMFDRLESRGIIVGWNRDDWEITTTVVGLDIRISPKEKSTG